MIKLSTLRSRGFSIVQLAGPVTQLTHNTCFTVNGKAARFVSGQYEFNVRDWYDKEIPREIVLV